MTESEMRRMLTLAHTVIANVDTLLKDETAQRLLPYAPMVQSQAEGWMEQYHALMQQELEGKASDGNV